MVHRERVSDTVYSFQSETYAQVMAGAVVGPDWVVVIDTLSMPSETLAIRDFFEQELKMPIRYVINTHYHADHCWGNYFFPGATVISSSLCRLWLEERGMKSLVEVRQHNLAFRNVKIILPHMTFTEGNVRLRVGKKTLNIFPLPGHSADNIAVHIEEDRALFAGDACMPIPYIVDGDIDELVASLKKISKMGLENMVQGHGDTILRGEVENYVEDHLAYLSCIRKAVRKASRRKYPLDLLEKVDVESCGKSRVLIGGLVVELHQRNLRALYRQKYGEEPVASGDEDDDYLYGDDRK